MQSARPEPAPAPRSGEWATPRRRTYLTGLAASLLLLLIGRSVLQADVPGPEESALAQNTAPASAVPAATTGPDAGEPAGPTTPGGEHGPPMGSSDSGAPPRHPMDRPPASSGPELGETGSATSIVMPVGPAIETPRPRLVTLIDEGCREVRLGDARRGVELLRTAYDRAPGELEVRWCLADGYAKLGKYESALRYYSDLLEESPRHAKALRGAAQANEYLNRRAAAGELYRRLLASDPDSASAKAFFAEEEKRARSP